MSGQRYNARRGHLVPVRLEPPVIDGRPPAHNLDAEGAVLSAILIDGARSLDRVRDLVTPEDCYSSANTAIFAAAIEVATVLGRVDLITVASWLRDRERLATVGGAVYLAQLADASPSVHHVEDHARIVRRLAKRRRFIAQCQLAAAEGYGDVGSDEAAWMRTHIDALRAHVDDGTDAPAAPIRDAVAELFVRLEERPEQRTIQSIPTGLFALDDLTAGLWRPELTLVMGRSGRGKSALAGCVSANVGRQVLEERVDGRGVHVPCGVVYVSAEMPKVQLVTRMACSDGRVNWHLVRKRQVGQESMQILYAAGCALADLPIQFIDVPKISMSRISARCRRVKAEMAARGVRLVLVVIDYAQILDTSDVAGRDMSREQEVSALGRAAKELSDALDASIWLLSQLNKAGDARESEALEHHADNVYLVSSEEPEDALEERAVAAHVQVRKQRHGPRNVRADLLFHPWCTLFTDV